MEITRTIPSACIPVTEPSQAGAARRVAASSSRELGLTEEEQGRAALIATELATNLVQHTPSGGEIIVAPAAGAGGIDIIALDRGPGIADLRKCLQDGYSTAGTAGHGLGSVKRAAALFDVYTAPGKGAVVFARVGGTSGAPGNPLIEVGAVCLHKAGEEISGDSWDAQPRPEGAALIVADGLGHGWGAAEASRAAVEAFCRDGALSPQESLVRVHAALRSTRGAAAAVAELNIRRGVVRFAGVGNIDATIVNGEASRSLISHNGILGHLVHKIHELSYPWQPGSLLVMHSDGANSHWDLGRYAGIANRHPVVIAALLYRDHSRQRDDITVVVAREAQV